MKVLGDVRTERLLLRRWRESDREPFAALSADPRVMEYFERTQSRADSDAGVDRVMRRWADIGFGFWAVEILGDAPFIGFAGLSKPPFDAHFTPCVEVGWRLAAEYWGRGYATEAARTAVRVGFEELGLDEIVALTVPANRRSIRVMEKLGMQRDPRDDFDHPMVAEGHPLRRHVLYRLRRSG
jgi:RimJ/RimL family protein N-acetyltransferase